jgi:hypothetical protein
MLWEAMIFMQVVINLKVYDCFLLECFSLNISQYVCLSIANNIYSYNQAIIIIIFIVDVTDTIRNAK